MITATAGCPIEIILLGDEPSDWIKYQDGNGLAQVSILPSNPDGTPSVISKTVIMEQIIGTNTDDTYAICSVVSQTGDLSEPFLLDASHIGKGAIDFEVPKCCYFRFRTSDYSPTPPPTPTVRLYCYKNVNDTNDLIYTKTQTPSSNRLDVYDVNETSLGNMYATIESGIWRDYDKLGTAGTRPAIQTTANAVILNPSGITSGGRCAILGVNVINTSQNWEFNSRFKINALPPQNAPLFALSRIAGQNGCGCLVELTSTGSLTVTLKDSAFNLIGTLETTNALLLDTEYYIKIIRNFEVNNSYSLLLSTNGTDYTLQQRVETAQNIFQGDFNGIDINYDHIGGGTNYTFYTAYFLDKNFYVKNNTTNEMNVQFRQYTRYPEGDIYENSAVRFADPNDKCTIRVGISTEE